MRLANTPKALANFSPGFERSENPGYANKWALNPERVSPATNPFRVELKLESRKPRVVAALQPWAEISQRLRRMN
jgi:hypothetical protein